MKKIFLLLLVCFYYNALFAQKKQILEAYSQKFYKIDNKTYGIKYPKKVHFANLFSIKKEGNEMRKIFPYSHFSNSLYTSYINLIYDITPNNFTVFEKMKTGPEIVSESTYLCFYPQKEPSEQEWSKISPNQRELSDNLTGLRDFHSRRAVGSRSDYWCYDIVLQKDETLLMPVAFKDSLYVYQYTDKAWTKPDYQGAEKNAQNDKWTRTSETKHSFKTSFRAFQIEKDLYFLTNSDTTIYKYENNQLKEVGKIKPTPYQRTLFLVDKDDNKVYFLMAKSIEIIAEERKRFALLTKDDELFKAVKRIIDEPDRK